MKWTVKNSISVGILGLLYSQILFDFHVVHYIIPHNLSESSSMLLIVLSFSFIIFMLLLQQFNFNAIYHYRFRSYFLSKWNFIVEKSSISWITDWDSGLLSEKFLDFLDKEKYELLHQTEQSLYIMQKVKLFWQPNYFIFIDFQEKDNNSTEIVLTSVIPYGINSWGRNRKNVDQIMADFQESLII